MKIIQVIGTLSLFLFFSNLYSVSAMIDGPDIATKPRVSKPAAEGKHTEELSSTDSDLSSARSSESHTSVAAAAKPKRYNADEIITEIQETTKKSYLKNRLHIGGEVFRKIKSGNAQIIQKFKAAVESFIEPDVFGWNCSAEYFEESGNLVLSISVPK